MTYTQNEIKFTYCLFCSFTHKYWFYILERFRTALAWLFHNFTSTFQSPSRRFEFCPDCKYISVCPWLSLVEHIHYLCCTTRGNRQTWKWSFTHKYWFYVLERFIAALAWLVLNFTSTFQSSNLDSSFEFFLSGKTVPVGHVVKWMAVLTWSEGAPTRECYTYHLNTFRL